jgi:hypothetical protein
VQVGQDFERQPIGNRRYSRLEALRYAKDEARLLSARVCSLLDPFSFSICGFICLILSSAIEDSAGLRCCVGSSESLEMKKIVLE